MDGVVLTDHVEARNNLRPRDLTRSNYSSSAIQSLYFQCSNLSV